MHCRPRALSSWCSTLLLMAACSGGKGSSAADSSVPREAEDATVSTVQTTDAAVDSFSVSVSASKTTLCPGECVTLTPHVENAEMALSFLWNDGHDQETLEVCPTETTSYQLSVAEEAAQVGEFVRGGRHAEDQITLSVKDCSVIPDDPVVCEFRKRYDVMVDRGPLGAAKPWVSMMFGGGSHIDTDRDGNLLGVAGFSGRVDLGGGELKSSSPANALVFKLDPQCNLLWSRALSAPVASDAYLPLAMRVDDEGNTVLAGIAGPVFNLDFLTRTTLSFSTELIVQKLGPDGQELYRTRYPAGPGGYVAALDVDREGNVYVAGLTNALSDLGTGPLGISPTAFYSYLLKLDPQGRSTLLQTRTGISRLAAGATQLFVERGGFTDLDVLVAIAGGGLGPAVPLELAGLSLSNQQERWQAARSESVAGLVAMTEDRFAHFTTNLAGTDASGELVTTASATLVVRDQAGAEQWNKSLYAVEYRASGDAGAPYQVFEVAPWLGHLAAGADGSLALAGTVHGAIEVLGQQASSVSENAALVMKLDAAGEPAWVRTLSWGDNHGVSGLAIAPDGSTYVTGQANVVGAPEEYDLVISKLRAAK